MRLTLTTLLALAAVAAPAAAQQAPTAIDRGSVIAPQAGSDEKGPFANRGGNLSAVMRALIADGIKFTVLGEEGGAKGYLGEAANGRFQSFYVTPDGEHVVTGLMFRSGGANVTSMQVGSMLRRFNDVAKGEKTIDVEGLGEIPADGPVAPASDVPFVDWLKASGMKLTPFLEKEGGVEGYMVESPGKDGRPGKIQPFYIMPDGKHAVVGVLVRRGGVFVTGLQIHNIQQKFLADNDVKSQNGATVVAPTAMSKPDAPKPPASAIDGKPLVSPPAPAEVAETAPVKPPAPPKPIEGVPAPTVSNTPISTKPPSAAAAYHAPINDQKAFAEAVKTTVFFTVGMAGKPAIYMVADPQCPFCHEAWRKLRPLVFDQKIQVRVILIAGLRGSDPLARSILSRKSVSLGDRAAEAWLRGEGSIPGVQIAQGPQPGSQEYEQTGRFLQINGAFAERFKISRTPFLFYNGTEGDMYASVGLPEDFDAFLAALK